MLSPTGGISVLHETFDSGLESKVCSASYAAAVFLACTFNSLRYRKEIIEQHKSSAGVYSMGPGHIVTTWSDKENCSVETFSL